MYNESIEYSLCKEDYYTADLFYLFALSYIVLS